MVFVLPVDLYCLVAAAALPVVPLLPVQLQVVQLAPVVVRVKVVFLAPVLSMRLVLGPSLCEVSLR